MAHLITEDDRVAFLRRRLAAAGANAATDAEVARATAEEWPDDDIDLGLLHGG